MARSGRVCANYEAGNKIRPERCAMCAGSMDMTFRLLIVASQAALLVVRGCWLAWLFAGIILLLSVIGFLYVLQGSELTHCSIFSLVVFRARILSEKNRVPHSQWRDQTRAGIALRELILRFLLNQTKVSRCPSSPSVTPERTRAPGVTESPP